MNRDHPTAINTPISRVRSEMAISSVFRIKILWFEPQCKRLTLIFKKITIPHINQQRDCQYRIMMAHDLSDKTQQLIIVLLFLILGLAGCRGNDDSSPVDRSPFKIVVVSDIHVRVPGNPDDGFYDSQANQANSMLVVDRINEIHMDADFVAEIGRAHV